MDGTLCGRWEDRRIVTKGPSPEMLFSFLSITFFKNKTLHLKYGNTHQIFFAVILVTNHAINHFLNFYPLSSFCFFPSFLPFPFSFPSLLPFCSFFLEELIRKGVICFYCFASPLACDARERRRYKGACQNF